MVALENLRAGSRRRSAHHQNILDADRNASEWPNWIALGYCFINLAACANARSFDKLR